MTRPKLWHYVDRHALITGWTALAVTASLFIQLWEIIR